MVNNHPNPMTVYGTVADLVHDPATGEVVAVDVIMPGTFNAQWDAAGIMMRSVAPANPAEAAMLIGASEARIASLSGTFCRAEVPIERVLAHATFRNVFLVSTLAYVQRELCLLWPESIALDDISFVDAKTGAPIEGVASMRSILDGEIGVRVCGVDVPVLDPTGCTKRGGALGWLFG